LDPDRTLVFVKAEVLPGFGISPADPVRADELTDDHICAILAAKPTKRRLAHPGLRSEEKGRGARLEQ
jgi:hypothetical protein